MKKLLFTALITLAQNSAFSSFAAEGGGAAAATDLSRLPATPRQTAAEGGAAAAMDLRLPATPRQTATEGGAAAAMDLRLPATPRRVTTSTTILKKSISTNEITRILKRSREDGGLVFGREDVLNDLPPAKKSCSLPSEKDMLERQEQNTSLSDALENTYAYLRTKHKINVIEKIYYDDSESSKELFHLINYCNQLLKSTNPVEFATFLASQTDESDYSSDEYSEDIIKGSMELTRYLDDRFCYPLTSILHPWHGETVGDFLERSQESLKLIFDPIIQDKFTFELSESFSREKISELKNTLDQVDRTLNEQSHFFLEKTFSS